MLKAWRKQGIYSENMLQKLYWYINMTTQILFHKTVVYKSRRFVSTFMEK